MNWERFLNKPVTVTWRWPDGQTVVAEHQRYEGTAISHAQLGSVENIRAAIEHYGTWTLSLRPDHVVEEWESGACRRYPDGASITVELEPDPSALEEALAQLGVG